MTAAYGSSGSFGSTVRSKYIGHNTYKVRRSNFCSETTPIHGPVHKSYLHYSYSRSHFSWSQKSVSKRLFFCLSQKVTYASKIIDPVINGFSTNEVKSHLRIYDHSIITFDIRVFCLGVLNTSRVESLYRFRKSVVDKVKRDICIFKNGEPFK